MAGLDAMRLRRDGSGEGEAAAILGAVLVLAGIVVLGIHHYGPGCILFGVGLLILGARGEASYDSPLGKIVAVPGLILIVLGIVLAVYGLW